MSSYTSTLAETTGLEKVRMSTVVPLQVCFMDRRFFKHVLKHIRNMREGKTTEVDGYIFSIVSLDSYEHIPFNNEFVKVRAEYTALVVKPEKGKTYHIKIRETGTVGSFALIEGVIRVFLSGVFYDVGIEVHIEIMMIRFLDGEITCLGKEIN